MLENIDNIIGIVTAKDIAMAWRNGEVLAKNVRSGHIMVRKSGINQQRTQEEGRIT